MPMEQRLTPGLNCVKLRIIAPIAVPAGMWLVVMTNVVLIAGRLPAAALSANGRIAAELIDNGRAVVQSIGPLSGALLPAQMPTRALPPAWLEQTPQLRTKSPLASSLICRVLDEPGTFQYGTLTQVIIARLAFVSQ